MHAWIRATFALLTGLFVWAAYLQLNDTAPWLWVAVYLGAGTLCGLGAAWIRVRPAIGYGYALATVAGAVYLAWRIWGVGDVTAMYGDGLGEEAGLVATKEGREMLGLLIVAVAAAGYGYWSDRGLSGTGE